jgi:hypothetical protein
MFALYLMYLNLFPTHMVWLLLSDSRIAGDKVAIDSDGVSVSGVGAALGNVALHQDRVYFEVRIVEVSVQVVGVY